MALVSSKASGAANDVEHILSLRANKNGWVGERGREREGRAVIVLSHIEKKISCAWVPERKILCTLNNIYIYMYLYVCMHVFMCVCM